MKTKLPTVTLAISALNEEKNISHFLKSVFMQKEDGFILDKIFVISDGSTDKTVEFAKSFKSEKIEILSYNERLGKAIRMNEVYKNLKSDILIQSDADVVLAHDLVIRNLILPIIENKEIALCGGNPIPFRLETFTQKAINCTIKTYAPLKKIKNIFSIDGKLLAIKKEFAKKLVIPDTIADDAYIYFSSIKNGYQYKFVQDAIVYYILPKNLSDQIKQNTRFILVHKIVADYFPKDVIGEEYSVSMLFKYNLMARQFLLHPVLSTYIFFVNKYCRIRATYFDEKRDSKWNVVDSTKNLKS